MSISRHPAQLLRHLPLRVQQLHSRLRLQPQRQPRLQLQLRSRLRQHQQLLTRLRQQLQLLQQLQPQLPQRQQRQLLLRLRPQSLPRPRQRLHPHRPLLQDLHLRQGLARHQGLGQLRRRARSDER